VGHDLRPTAYRSFTMVETPWGDPAELRTRKLPPGRGNAEAVKRNQRERLFAAMVAALAEQDFEAITVADLLRLSGVSRKSFYGHFADQRECLVAAIEALAGPAVAAIEAGLERPGDVELAKQAFENLFQRIVAGPATAKMCFVDVYAAGPAGVALVDRTIDAFEVLLKQMFDQMPGYEEMPSEIVRALIGGVQKVIHKRLLRGQEEQLVDLAPQLWDWLFLYPTPPGELKPPRRVSRKVLTFEERQAASLPPERILRALAAVVSEKGYHETNVEDIVKRARTSTRTFYDSFETKEDAMVAALDSGSQRMLAEAMPAFRRPNDWQHKIQATQEAMFSFGVLEPEYAHLGAVEIFEAGTRALEQREVVTEGMEALLKHGVDVVNPSVPPITPEAIGGALYTLFYDHVRRKGAKRLPEIVPPVVYVTLVPFLGAEEAFSLATK
jgi:AcrR family transcriptional regulator